MPARDFRDLIAWQKAMEFVVLVYKYSRSFPNEERFGLTRGSLKTHQITEQPKDFEKLSAGNARFFKAIRITINCWQCTR